VSGDDPHGQRSQPCRDSDEEVACEVGRRVATFGPEVQSE